MAAPGIPLRFKRPLSWPIVGRIGDAVDFKTARLPLHMWEEGEEIPDDPEDADLVKDAAYYREQRKRRRSFYRGKQIYKFQDSAPRQAGGPPAGLQYEGSVWDPAISTEVEKQEKRIFYHSNAARQAVEEQAFRYVIFVPVKVPSVVPGGPEGREIQVVPVRDFVRFQKPSVSRMKTLDEIDEDFETKMQRDKKKEKQYARIMKVGSDGSAPPSSLSPASYLPSHIPSHPSATNSC